MTSASHVDVPMNGISPGQILEARRSEVRQIIEERGLKNPRVFGSVARGTDGPGSDIDILVEVPPEHAWEFVSLPRELTNLLGVRVELVSERGLKARHAKVLIDARAL